MHQTSYSVFIIAALILFSIYRRVRRNIGWQQLSQGKIWFRTVLLVIIGLLFLGEGIFHPISLISDVVGIIIGIILAYYSAGMTRFEQRDGGLYYRPNTWIGSIVTVIFLARLGYRIYGIYTQGSLGGVKTDQTSGWQNMGYTAGNSWTSGLMLIMFAYYVIYFIILLRKQKHLSHSGDKFSD
ncbi:CcdC protein domain-containing protein [Neobacillus ginsengisoli]|uniref:DUF1453 domain-containing protein n=1 Tax=Neobacillus ginsengisoli TaxID=904295 RepID=A0ABT9XXM7_9BACI|nr:CcdC protein domain-containing protein [Neobacillus ginsengisoli]MDQ0200328.1 hypothetical protein [Neobacillus ginsengisoli]